MNNYRSIRIATGIKKIELGAGILATQQVRELLQEHREFLLGSLLADLKTYVAYKFSRQASKAQLEEIRSKLFALRGSPLSLSKYGVLIDRIIENESTHVESELFYHEVNDIISSELNPSQLEIIS